MSLSFTVLNVFTSAPWSGNPLAIVRVPCAYWQDLSKAEKQRIATQFNLSETVFLYIPLEGDKDSVRYDIYTPKSQIPFAGHPTIGTVVYIKLHGPDDIKAYSPDVFGEFKKLTTEFVGDVPVTWNGATSMAKVVVPHEYRVHRTRLPHPTTLSGQLGHDRVPIVSIVKGMSFILVPVQNLAALGQASSAGSGNGSIVPPADTYKGLHLDPEDGWGQGIVNTMYYVVDQEFNQDFWLVGEEIQLRTRVIGRIEDPGTGSASCALCCFLAMTEMNRSFGAGPFQYHLVQGVEMGRRNDIWVVVTRTQDGTGLEKVELMGTAVKVMEGTIEIQGASYEE